jgi:hypothetical protein
MGGGTSRRRLVPSHNSHLRDLPRRLKAASRRPRRLAACEWWTGRPGGGTLSSDAPGELVAQPRLCSRLDRLETSGASPHRREAEPRAPASGASRVLESARRASSTAPGESAHRRGATLRTTNGGLATAARCASRCRYGDNGCVRPQLGACSGRAVQQRDQPGEAAVGVPKQHPVRLQAASGASRAGIPALLSVVAETQPLDLHG